MESREVVKFSVSGTLFEIKIEDLKKYESSVLASMLDGQQEIKGQVYIQRDPDVFKLVMKFLRAQRDTDFKNLKPWSKLSKEESQEFEFWQLDEDYKSKVREPPAAAVKPAGRKYGADPFVWH